MEKLSYSRIACFKECRRQFFYRYERGLAPKERPLALSFGSAFHAALAVWYEKNDLAAAIEMIIKEMNSALAMTIDPEQQEKTKDAAALATGIFHRYIQQYAHEDFSVIEIEPEYVVPIVKPGSKTKSAKFEMLIRPDLVIKRTDGLWIKETKTAAGIDTRYKAKLTLDPQSLLYIVGVEQALGRPVKGILYDVILKDIPKQPRQLKNGSLSQDKGQHTTPELYVAAIQDLHLNPADYTEFVSYLAANRREYFYREYISFPDEDRLEWQEELWQLAVDISEARRMKRFYKNPANCLRTFNCSFFPVCTAIDKEWVIRESFENVAERLAREEMAEQENGAF